MMCRIDLCLRLGLSKVMIFSDYLEVVNVMTQPDFVLGPIGAVAMDIQKMLERASFLSIRHMHWTKNNRAHLLARKALLSSFNLEWHEVFFPSWLKNAVIWDLLI